MTSPLLKLTTLPLARNKSENINEVVPNALPSDVEGAIAPAVIVISSEPAILKWIVSSVSAVILVSASKSSTNSFELRSISVAFVNAMFFL